ncbi:MAG TPA: ABC transporter substrate-binding protein [Vitreimonas sp.]|uniref:ABC transporter substrate-binding protein n=1 Tax=Vitreimonas sp. TaxID=3069702 RepID=UPI002D2AF542|nr:ABC transporter substrate-binding protein [Vitreimonas sp.]HYD87993.1 ABC transporter substrate-binding protein [Vitreimonas sp.]
MAIWTSRRSLLAGAGGVGVATSLGGCANARIVGFDKAKKSLDIANSSEPLSLDPHKATGSWENNIIGNMFVGLTTENERSEPIPGMAERWEVSDDLLTWTFYLRRATWSDGEACDAHDFEFGFKRIMNPDTLAQYASILYPIKNAQAVNTQGMAVDQLGVRAIDDLTLEIQLEHPAPYLPQLLKHYTAFPIPKHVHERVGEEWIKPENIVVNGAFILRRWWSNYIIHLERNPRFFDAPNVVLEHLYFYPQNDVQAAARKVLSGEAGWSTRFPSNQVEVLRRDLPGYVRVATYLTCNYFSFNMTKPPFDDMRVRQAMAMAYDRDFVASQIYRTGEQPAYKFVPPGVYNYPSTARYRWAERPLEERKREAERLLRAAGYGPNNPLRFAFSHRNTSDNPRVAVVAQNDWNSIAPWVTVELRGVENQVHYANLRAKNFDAGDGGWIGDFNDAKNFLYLFESRTGSQNYPGYNNATYDNLVHQSDLERDDQRRAQLMLQAEQLLLDEAPICTSVFINSTNLVHPDLTGYADNLEDIHRARWFGIRNA